MAIISVTVQLWVISVYFNIRNTLPKFLTFLPGHPVYIKPDEGTKEPKYVVDMIM
jgi:hypothetical protein